MESLIPAAKMNGLGNAILIMDMRGGNRQKAAGRADNTLKPAFVRLLAQNPQTAFDQIMALYDKTGPAENAAYKVEIWNCDGTQAKACGNGARCLAEYLWREQPDGRKNSSKIFHFATKGGIVTAERLAGGSVTVTMGRPSFDPHSVPINFTPEDMGNVPLAALLPPGRQIDSELAQFPQTAVILSVGNPHAVFFLPAKAVRPLEAWPLAEFGAMLEKSPVFPQGVNVSLAQVKSPDLINLRVWERGAGLTQACGTAACATAIAAHKRSLAQAQIAVTLPGGTLTIALSGGICHMTGPTDYECAGFINPQNGAFRRDPR